jgi:hypothetical protein
MLFTQSNRASAHLSAIVDRLLASAGKKIQLNAAWKELVVNLVREVVSSVDPDVRAGRDTMDIRPYVKIKVIPGMLFNEITSALLRGSDDFAYPVSVCYRRDYR